MKTPVIIFPTQSLMIDDDIIYARLFTKNMLHNEGVLITPSCPDLMKTIIEQGENDFLFTINSNKVTSVNKLSKKTCEIKEQLHGVISVLIADFHMPDMSGIDFFEKITSPFIYKIIISNFIDEYPIEINKAINNGIINAYYRKNQQLYKELKKSIIKGQQQFFSLLSNEIAYPSPAINDPEVAKFIWDMIEKLKPEDMHGDDKMSRFLFKKDDKSQTLIIMSIDEVNNILESYQAEIANPYVIKNLASQKFILTCKDPFSINGSEWDNFLRPAQKIKGRFNDYLFTIMDDNIYG